MMVIIMIANAMIKELRGLTPTERPSLVGEVSVNFCG
jgi:hypothetical protein